MKLTINELRSVLRHLKDGNQNQKVFGIGNHKTGTTTLNYIMHGLGFNCAPQTNLERDCTLETIKGNYKPLTKYIHHFDFFQDSPFAHANTYVAIDALFPKSKFIYTYRDSNEWFESNINYVAQWCKTQPSKLNRSHYASYGYISKDYMIKKTEYYEISEVNIGQLRAKPNWNLLFDKEKYIKEYENRRDEILKYFQNRSQDFLAIDITKEKSVKKITHFLGYPKFIDFQMPKLNANQGSENKEIIIENKDFLDIINDYDLEHDQRRSHEQ